MTEVKEKNIYEDIAGQKSDFINEDLSFDSIVNNPVLKPLAEVNRSILDLEEMNSKRLSDADREHKWLVAMEGEIPQYSDTIFITRLWKLNQITGDIIKSQNIELKVFKSAINEMLKIIKDKYGVMTQEYHKPSEELNYEDYLSKVSKNPDEKISTIAKQVLTSYLNKNGKSEKRFIEALGEILKLQTEKENKIIINKLMKREY